MSLEALFGGGGGSGGSLIGAFGGLFASNKQAKANKRAAEQQRQAQEQALKLQREQFEYAKTLQQPYQQFGLGGIQNLSDPNANFVASPDYDYRMRQGMGAITQNRALGGTLQSGAALKSLNRFGQDVGSSEFGNWYNRNMQRAGIGQGATGALMGAGSQYAGNAGNIYGNIGDINANRITNAANIQAAQMGNFMGTLTGSGGSGGLGGVQNYFAKPKQKPNPWTGATYNL